MSQSECDCINNFFTSMKYASSDYEFSEDISLKLQGDLAILLCELQSRLDFSNLKEIYLVCLVGKTLKPSQNIKN